MSTELHPAIDRLRAFLGEERFRRFVGQVAKLSGAEGLHSWHCEVLDEFEHATSLSLPRSAHALAPLLAGAIPDPPRLAEADTPEWVHAEFRHTQCPVQVEGWCYVGGSGRDPDSVVWNFYFRARGGHWSISASDREDPVGLNADDEHSFYHEEPYEARTGEYDAGYMPHDVARYYVIRELEKLRSRERVR